MPFLTQPAPESAFFSADQRRANRSRLLLAALMVAASLSILFATGCSLSEEGKADDSKVVIGRVQTFGGVGSTFVDPRFTHCSNDYAKTHRGEINSRPVGSRAGITELENGNPTFAAADVPFIDNQLKSMPPILQSPVTAGPVHLTYNLPTLNSPLRLSGRTLAGIFSGDIITGQDSAIVAENPGAGFPYAAIIVVHRSDGSGTSGILTSYLSSVSPE
jgi:phosphate transport system substrate-binding protein